MRAEQSLGKDSLIMPPTDGIAKSPPEYRVRYINASVWDP